MATLGLQAGDVAVTPRRPWHSNDEHMLSGTWEAAAGTHDEYLRRRISRMLDEDTSKTLEVLVQLQVPETWESIFNATAQAISRRNAVVSARDLVPPDYPEVMDAQRRKRPAGRHDVDVHAYFRTSLLNPQGSRRQMFTATAIARVGRATSIGETASRKARELNRFQKSGTLLIRAHRDIVARWGDDESLVGGVAEFFANRRHRLPGYSRSTRLPREVEDNKTHTWGIARTGALAVWGAFGLRGEGVKVAVLDTGIDASHPDLKGKVADFAEFDDIGQRRLRRKPRDTDQHGTHVSGTIVGGAAGGRWIGMAPAARILAGVVLPKGEGTTAQISAGMEWAIESGADVICMSLGGLQMTPDVLDEYTSVIIAANQAGIPVVVAIGNDGSQTSSSPGNDFFAFGVGGTDIDDRAAGFSGGRTQIIEKSRYIDERYLPLVYSKPDVTAPGVAVLSAVPGGKWETWNGTSMATPHVAGAMALLMSDGLDIRKVRGEQRTQLVQDLLVSTVKELGEAGQNHRFGYGRIDVLRAVGYAVDRGYGSRVTAVTAGLKRRLKR